MPPTQEDRYRNADLQRARTAVADAELTPGAAERYLAAHVAALRIAAVILAARTHPAVGGRRSRPRNAWQLVAVVAPEFAEWAAYFAAGEGKRDAVRAGATAIVSTREADDLVRDVQQLLGLVERGLGRIDHREAR